MAGMTMPSFNYQATMTPGGLGDALTRLGQTVATTNAQRREAELRQQGLGAQLALSRQRLATDQAFREAQGKHYQSMEDIARMRLAQGPSPEGAAKADYYKSLIKDPNRPTANDFSHAQYMQKMADQQEMDDAKAGSRPFDPSRGKLAYQTALAEAGFNRQQDGTWMRPTAANPGQTANGGAAAGFPQAPPAPPGFPQAPPAPPGIVGGPGKTNGVIPGGDGVQNAGQGGTPGGGVAPSGGPGSTAVLPVPPPAQPMNPGGAFNPPAQVGTAPMGVGAVLGGQGAPTPAATPQGLSAALAPTPGGAPAPGTPPPPSAPPGAVPANGVPMAAPALPGAGKVLDRATFQANHGSKDPGAEARARQQGYTFSDDAPAGGAPPPPQQ